MIEGIEPINQEAINKIEEQISKKEEERTEAILATKTMRQEQVVQMRKAKQQNKQILEELQKLNQAKLLLQGRKVYLRGLKKKKVKKREEEQNNQQQRHEKEPTH